MFDGIKDLMKASQNLEEIKGKLTEYTANVSTLSDEMKKFREELDLLKQHISLIRDKQSDLVDNFHESVGYMNDLNKEFKQTIGDFSALRGDLQSYIIQKFDAKLNEELVTHLDQLKQNAQHYSDLKEKVSGIMKDVAVMSAEVAKFTDISKNIKKEDFELSRFTQNVMDMDREKLELLKKIDNLERLISKMRQSGQQNNPAGRKF
jgi:chromosome segregation ATPase